MSDDPVIQLVAANDDPEISFVETVLRGLKERDINCTVVLTLDNNGKLSMHASTNNIERVLAITSNAQRYSLDMWIGSLANGQFKPDGGDSSTPAA